MKNQILILFILFVLLCSEYFYFLNVFRLFYDFSLLFKVVQEYERAVIFRLGRLHGGGAKGPGRYMEHFWSRSANKSFFRYLFRATMHWNLYKGRSSDRLVWRSTSRGVDNARTVMTNHWYSVLKILSFSDFDQRFRDCERWRGRVYVLCSFTNDVVVSKFELFDNLLSS